MSKKSSPKALPRIKKSELEKKTKFEEKNELATQGREGTLWIIVFALAILIVFAILVWAFFSNRPTANLNEEDVSSEDNSSRVQEWEEAEDGEN